MQTNTEDAIFEAHRYRGQIQEVYLVGSTKEVLDVTDLFVTAELYEDLFSPSVSGNLVLKNNKGTIKDLKLNGADRLVIVVSDVDDGKIALEFLVYSHHYAGTTDTFELVGLNFVSFPHVLSQNSHIWRAYKGNIAGIVKNVFDELTSAYTPKALEEINTETPTLECDSTEGVVKFVSPGWTPFQLIAWLSGRATNPNTSGSLFTFYQTIFDGYKFKSVENLIKEGNDTDLDKEKCLYYGFAGDGYEKNNIKRISFGRIGDTLKNYKELYNDLWMTDFTKKTITKRSYDASVSASALLNDEKIGVQNANNGFDFDFVGFRERGNLLANRSNESTLIHNDVDFLKGNSLQRKFAILRQLNAMTATFEIFNNTAIKVGEVVDLDITQKRTINESDTADDIKDKELSGRYLVSAVSLKYDLEQVKMQVEAIKDSILGE